MPTLLIATHNRGKLAEFQRLLATADVELVCLADVGIGLEIEESGLTFEANAKLKASGYAIVAEMFTLADDSGLVVDHLNGRPGVLSARYAGADATDQQRIEKLLCELKGTHGSERSARFECAISLAGPDGSIAATVSGQCTGSITNEPRGDQGFGYDPVFQPTGFSETFGELGPETKDRISHRADAAVKIIPFLRGFFDI